MIPASWRRGEIAVIGLGKSGAATAEFLSQRGLTVYASDCADTARHRAAAERVARPGITVELGRHDIGRIRRSSLVVCSPGVPPEAEPLVAARSAAVEVLGELDLAALFLDEVKLVVVTGTNGKTTTTALIERILTEAGLDAVAAGNIGSPLIEVAGAEVKPEWAIVEASSFQLHDASHLRPKIGVVTNLAPDHLDRYESVSEYYEDKRRLFLNASADATWVLNRDDARVLSLAERVAGVKRHWSMRQPEDAWYDGDRECLVLGDGDLLQRSHLALLGDHNVANALAASLVACVAGVDPGAIARGLRSFSPLPHRLEPVPSGGSVAWINDSKATNVASVMVAVAAMERCFVLIAGGRPKGESFVELGESLQARCRGVVAYGESRRIIENQVGRFVSVAAVPKFEDAVIRARSLACSGDAVLLSPGCSSFDQFENYQVRGDVFRELVGAM
ncbi:MAG: UDP-N-acetylmuramoyl-L-alanine--D-glutamate ligase [Gemmatimonadales bacterium]